MLSPKNPRYFRAQKHHPKGHHTPKTDLAFGVFGLKAVTGGQVSAQVLEAARRSLTRKLKRTGQLWCTVFPSHPLTKKPSEVRMGRGKGGHDRWVVRVKPGHMIFELAGVKEEWAREACRLAAHKLPIKTVFYASRW